MASTTLTEYRAAVNAAIGLDSVADNDLLTRWINEGYERFVADTHCYVDTATLALTSGEHTYDLPSGAMAILEMYNNSGADQREFCRVSLPEIVQMRRAVSSAPARYYATAGSNLITVYPTPSADEELTFFYVVRPTAMSGSSETPTGVPAEFQQAIEFHACARAAEFDNHEPSQYGTYYRALYEREVQLCRKAMRNMGGNRSASIVPGYRERGISNDRARIYHWR